MPSNFQQLLRENQAIGRNPKHSLLAPYSLNILLNSFLRNRRVTPHRRHFLKHIPDVLNLLRHFIEVHITMTLKPIYNVRSILTLSLHRKIIFFVFVDFKHEIGIIELHLIKTVEVEECLY